MKDYNIVAIRVTFKLNFP